MLPASLPSLPPCSSKRRKLLLTSLLSFPPLKCIHGQRAPALFPAQLSFGLNLSLLSLVCNPLTGRFISPYPSLSHFMRGFESHVSRLLLERLSIASFFVPVPASPHLSWMGITGLSPLQIALQHCRWSSPVPCAVAARAQPLLEMPCLWKRTIGLHVPFSLYVCHEWFLMNTVVSWPSEILFLHYYLQIQELETSGIGPRSMTLNLVLLSFIAYLLLHISMPYTTIFEGY